MVYFFHHYELPTIVQQAQLQQLLLRNEININQRREMNNHQNVARTTQTPWFMQIRRGRFNNDSNNNRNHYFGLNRANLTSRIISLFRDNHERPDIARQEQRRQTQANSNITNVLDDADTRSNFQRNYEENNFLFPSDILMRERDRLTNVNRTPQHSSLSVNTLYSFAPVPEQISTSENNESSAYAAENHEASANLLSPVFHSGYVQNNISSLNNQSSLENNEIEEGQILPAGSSQEKNSQTIDNNQNKKKNEAEKSQTPKN